MIGTVDRDEAIKCYVDTQGTWINPKANSKGIALPFNEEFKTTWEELKQNIHEKVEEHKNSKRIPRNDIGIQLTLKL